MPNQTSIISHSPNVHFIDPKEILDLNIEGAPPWQSIVINSLWTNEFGKWEGMAYNRPIDSHTDKFYKDVYTILEGGDLSRVTRIHWSGTIAQFRTWHTPMGIGLYDKNIVSSITCIQGANNTVVETKCNGSFKTRPEAEIKIIYQSIEKRNQISGLTTLKERICNDLDDKKRQCILKEHKITSKNYNRFPPPHFVLKYLNEGPHSLQNLLLKEHLNDIKTSLHTTDQTYKTHSSIDAADIAIMSIYAVSTIVFGSMAIKSLKNISTHHPSMTTEERILEGGEGFVYAMLAAAAAFQFFRTASR